MAGTREEWNGLLNGKRPKEADLEMIAPIERSKGGGSGAFLASAAPHGSTEGEQYWVKTLNNLQHPRVPINEQVVGRAGRLINAPVPDVGTVFIPDALVGWEFRPGHYLEKGIAHAGSAVKSSTETRTLDRRNEDDNQKRHAGILALYDWCWGEDTQWLVVNSEQNAYYSHDHGHYFPGGPAWTEAGVLAQINVPHEHPGGYAGITQLIVNEIAERLSRVTRSVLVTLLSAIPIDWPVTDTELESLGFFLEARAESVAARLRAKGLP